MSARRYYAVALIGVVALGLASRRYPALFPAVLGKYPGDALWALMVFCGLGFLNPGLSTLRLAVYALLISYVDEFTQLYQFPWINEIRGTDVGHLILGSTFSWYDMLAYTVGVAFGALCKAIRRKPAFQINGAVNSIPSAARPILPPSMFRHRPSPRNVVTIANTHMTRRESLLAVAAPVVSGIVNSAPAPSRKLNVVCVGGHPDDPESGCGGTLARYSGRGHNVTIIYLTRGEAGIPGKTHDEAAAIRTEEALKACRVLGATPVFAGQTDGSSEITNARYEAFEKLLSGQRPDVVFTHWPVDTHRDHCAASLLTFQAWDRNGKKYPLVYFEVMSGEQTQQFAPNFYVDVTETWEKKKEACFLHASQEPSEFYACHEQMERFRGLEYRCKRAEAFVVHSQGPLAPVVW